MKNYLFSIAFIVIGAIVGFITGLNYQPDQKTYFSDNSYSNLGDYKISFSEEFQKIPDQDPTILLNLYGDIDHRDKTFKISLDETDYSTVYKDFQISLTPDGYVQIFQGNYEVGTFSKDYKISFDTLFKRKYLESFEQN